MQIKLTVDLPVAEIHKCTKGKVYNARMIHHKIRGRLDSMVILAESGLEVTVLSHEYTILEYDNENRN